MIKGINHRVVEVSDTGSEYFEKILFFVRPEYSSINEGKLRQRAGAIANSTSAPPSNKKPKLSLKKVVKTVFIALVGAAITLAVMKFVRM